KDNLLGRLRTAISPTNAGGRCALQIGAELPDGLLPAGGSQRQAMLMVCTAQGKRIANIAQRERLRLFPAEKTTVVFGQFAQGCRCLGRQWQQVAPAQRDGPLFPFWSLR